MSNARRILMLTTEGLLQHVGGLGTYVRALRREFERWSTFRVDIREIPLDSKYLERPEFDPSLAKALDRADVIHANDYFTGCVALRRRRNGPLLTTAHMLHQRFTYEDCGTPIHVRRKIADLEREAFTGADIVVAVSKHMGEELASLDLELPPMYVVPNGAGSHFFEAPQKQPSQVLRLGLVGRLVDQKGVRLVVPFIERMLRTNAEWTLTVVGDGPYERWLSRCVAACGATSRCRFRG